MNDLPDSVTDSVFSDKFRNALEISSTDREARLHFGEFPIDVVPSLSVSHLCKYITASKTLTISPSRPSVLLEDTTDLSLHNRSSLSFS